jgi:hypothetical protein
MRQGAGLVDIDDALEATTQISPGKLSLGDGGDARATPELTIANGSRRAVTYAVSSVDGLAVIGRDVLAARQVPAPSTVEVFQGRSPVTSVTVPPFGRTTLRVRVTPAPDLPDDSVYGGFLVFTPSGGAAPLRVPFAGYRGDYSATPLLSPTAYGLPWLARQTGLFTEPSGRLHPLYEQQAADAVFTLKPVTFGSRTARDVPVVLLHLAGFARRIQIDVLRRGRGRAEVVGQAFAGEHLPRNATDNLLGQSLPWTLTTALPFNGTVRHGRRRVELPDGAYQLAVTIERPLARRGTPVDRWTTPVFRIDR